MDKFILLVLFSLATLSPLHADNVVTMTTALPAGSSFAFTVNAGTYTVDWGDGAGQEVVSTGQPIVGIVAGPVIKCTGELITTLDCSGQQLTRIGLTGATAITALDCSNNQLTSLNLRAQKDLKTLDISNNQISTLTQPSARCIEVLIASNNALEGFVPNKVLRTLWIDGNQLKSLSLANATGLESLICDNNQISEIKLGPDGLPGMVDFWMASNKMSELTLDNIPLLETLNVADNGLWNLTLGVDEKTSKLLQVFLGGNNLTQEQLLPSNYAKAVMWGDQLEWKTQQDVYQVGDTIMFPEIMKNAYTKESMATLYDLCLPDGTKLTRSIDYTYGQSRLTPYILKFKKSQPDPVHLEVTTKKFPDVVYRSAPFKVVDEITGIGAVEQSSLTVSREGNYLVVSSPVDVLVTVCDNLGRVCWKGHVCGSQRIPVLRGVYVVNGRKIAF